MSPFQIIRAIQFNRITIIGTTLNLTGRSRITKLNGLYERKIFIEYCSDREGGMNEFWSHIQERVQDIRDREPLWIKIVVTLKYASGTILLLCLILSIAVSLLSKLRGNALTLGDWVTLISFGLTFLFFGVDEFIKNHIRSKKE